MTHPGGVTPSVLDTLEFHAALGRVAEHARGPLGAARIMSRRPSFDPDPIRESLAQVAELAAQLITDEGINAESVPDVTPALDLLAVEGSALEPRALLDVLALCGAARLVGTELKRLEHLAPRTAALRVDPLPKPIEPRLEASIGPDGMVLDGASPDLARARKAVREAREKLVTRLEQILAGLKTDDRSGDAGVTVRNNRYVIPVRSTSRARVGGIVHDESATRATVFVEPPEVIELGNELRAREAAEQREVLRVLRELTDILRPHRELLARSLEMCVAFDDTCARARYAVQVNGHAPTIGGGPLAIHDGRHPLLDGGERVVVPFDLVLEGDEWTILVSGPNTGGKTVLIKAVGLLSLLSQSGVIPPIGPRSSLPVFTGFYADIGDKQSIAESLSTFSAHTRTLREILDGAGAGSLVLLDEIGSGTDPAEGGALAAATLRTLTRRHAVTLATTHLGALKQLAAETVGIVNASLQFDAETLTPSYRLLKGVPGRSYGLAIARRLGLPADVLADAERSVPDAERSLDRLLAAVEARRQEVEARALEVEQRDQALREEREVVERRGDDVEDRERAVRDRERSLDAAARDQARAYLLDARKTVEAALAQARAAVDEATAREARRLVEEAIEKTDGKREAGSGKREAAGGWQNLEDLKRARGAPTLPASHFPLSEIAAGESEISLIGLRAGEAEAMLVRALDAAIESDLPFLRIIHGKGTGALRKMVHEVLGADRRVSRFGFAAANQGGAGVTVAELKA
ncbi:MAG TPA: Smr/MutS family protein [Gemmatimonadales bacterium]|nr:Smr/MutS family protein [Gemmatimonadales bacterium]